MADANARRQAIKQASHQVRTGSAFVRRAPVAKPAAPPKRPDAPKRPSS